jgi:RimJ/RimL family protein N-acetyltransferase
MASNHISAVVVCCKPVSPTWINPLPKPKPIGVITIKDKNRNGAYTYHHRNGELKIAMAVGYRNAEYQVEAMRWALGWAFRAGNLHCVSTWCISDNDIVSQCCKDAGFLQDGRLRHRVYHDGVWKDTLEFSMLEGERWKLLGNADYAWSDPSQSTKADQVRN